MSTFIGRLLVLFYVITIPVFLGLYVASMVSAHPKFDALWFDGGVTEYGPAAFLVLLAVFVFPALVSFVHYLLSDAQSCLKNVLYVSLWMAPWPIGAAIVAKGARTEFPMAITMMSDKLILGAVILIIGVTYSVYSMYDSLTEEEEHREVIKRLARQHGLNQRDANLIIDQLGAVFSTWNRHEGRGSYEHYISLHLRNFRALRLSVEDYWSFVATVIGDRNFFKDAALAELEQHVRFSAQSRGMDSYLHFIGELKRSGLHDESLGHYFKDAGASGFAKLRLNTPKEKVSLDQCLQEYRIGEFTSVAEYLEFLHAKPTHYMSPDERSKYQAEADRLTHPVLHRMLALGGFYRARALQIAQRSMPREIPPRTDSPPPPNAPVFSPPAPPVIPTTSAVPPPPPPDPGIEAALVPSYYGQPASVMISRRGQIIFNEVKLQNLQTLVMQGHVLMSDHYWCQGMPGWSPVSAYSSVGSSRQVPKAGVDWGEVFKDFFLSWLLYVLGGVFIAGLLGYGNGGMSGVGSAIGGFLGFIILVRPVTFVFRTLFRLAIGKRGMELFR